MLTWVEVNTKALDHNLRQFKKKIGNKTLLMPVIKRNAYGHGFFETAAVVNQSSVVDRICVASLEEAVALIKKGIKKPIIILSFYELDSPDLSLAIKKKVAFPVYTREQIVSLNKLATKLKKRAIIHVKVDTGTSRVGFLPEDAMMIGKFITKQSNIFWEGIWSHFSSSEENPKETMRQKNIFDAVCKSLKKEGIDPPLKHFACTAATMLYPETRYNAVRLGLGTYGLYPSPGCKKINITLSPVLSWRTKLIQTKKIPEGTAVSYGQTYVVKRLTKLGIVPIGYYDGFDRRFSSNADVLVKGERCPVIGRICMNLTMIDLTDLKQKVAAGEVVTLIGAQKNGRIAVDELAKKANTINYEIVDRINPLLPRILT